MLGKILKFNWASFLSMVALVIIGVIFIKSSGEARTITALHDAWRVHAATALFGLIVYFTLAFIDYRKILDLFATPYFWISLIMLVAVLAFGSKVYGGKRWLWFFQPSEIAKPAVILMFAKMLGRADRPTNGFLDLMKGVGIVAVPALLILAEPDMGTALVLVPTALAMLLCARVCLKVLIPLLVAGTLSAGLVLGAVHKAETTTDPELKEKVERLTKFLEGPVQAADLDGLYGEQEQHGEGSYTEVFGDFAIRTAKGYFWIYLEVMTDEELEKHVTIEDPSAKE